MKILITGGAGFQGSHLSEALLKDGHTVAILNTLSDNAKKNIAHFTKDVDVIWGSITDPEIVTKSVRGHDVVFHLAAHINVDESLKHPLDFYHGNVLGTHNVLHAAIEHNARVILASTCEVYGDGHDIKENETIAENAEMRPNSPYAASKAAADRMAHAYHKSFGVDVTIVRPFNVFGERQKSGLYGALIPILVGRALRKEPLTIFGSGAATRDFSHVSDVVAGYRMILNSSDLKGEAINLASGKNTSVKDIAEYIAKKLNVPINHGPERPGEVMRFPADITKATKKGYSPRTDIWKGIDRYIDWASAESKNAA